MKLNNKLILVRDESYIKCGKLSRRSPEDMESQCAKQPFSQQSILTQ